MAPSANFIIFMTVIGFMAGFLLAILWVEIKASRQEKDPYESETEDRPTHFDDLEEVSRLWRDPKDDTLVVEVDQQPVHSSAFLNPVQRDRLAKAFQDLQAWMGIETPRPEPAKETKGAAEPNAGTVLDLTEAPIERPATTPEPVADPEPAEGVEGVEGPEEPSQRVKSGLMDLFGIGQPTQPEEDAPPREDEAPRPIYEKSMAEKVDDVLQENLKDSPLFDRAIRIMELSGRGMVFAVGLDIYDEIEDLPDEDIRAIIRQSVEQWSDSLEDD